LYVEDYNLIIYILILSIVSNFKHSSSNCDAIFSNDVFDIRFDTKEATCSFDKTSQIPSHARITNAADDCLEYPMISGEADMIFLSIE
jgi:hypothetical protein